MHKDELIQLHVLLAEVCHRFELATQVPTPTPTYDHYGVLPTHIHKSKYQHKRAVFLLGKDLADAMAGNDSTSETHKVAQRLQAVAGVKR